MKIWKTFPVDNNLKSFEFFKKFSIKNENTEMELFVKKIYNVVKHEMQDIELLNADIEYSFNFTTDKISNETIKKKIPHWTILYFFTQSEISNVFIVSEIETEKYKYKELDEKNVFHYTPVEKNMLVLLQNNYYGFLKYDEKNIFLKINIWQTNKEMNNNIQPGETPKILNLFLNNEIDEYIKTNEIVESILYGKITEKDQTTILNRIQKGKILTIKYLKTNKIDKNTEVLWKDKYGDYVHHLLPFYNGCELNEENPLNRVKIIQNIFALDVSCWIISESRKQEWKSDLYLPFSKVLNVENIPTISSFLIFASNFWIYNIRDIYGIPNNIPLKIENIYICHQFNTKDIFENASSYFLKMVIGLNDDYNNGAFYFQDEPENKNVLKRCDAVIYNGLKKINYEPVDGNRFFIVVLINLEL